MFLKQYNYKPRSGSTGSQGGNDAAQQAQQAAAQQPAQVAAAASPPKEGSISAAAAGRRRSSAGQFAGLQGHKRNSGEMKRENFAEQSQSQGVLGQMWNNFTKK